MSRDKILIMKIFGLLLTVMMTTSAHANFTDFSGTWIGECVRNGQTVPTKREISQPDENSILITGEAFTLNKPTIRDLSGNDSGEWKEVRVYDWAWNKDKTEIMTNVHWLGWYIDQHGTWSGKGTGFIRFQNGSLEMNRNFEQEFNGTSETINEICNYNRQ